MEPSSSPNVPDVLNLPRQSCGGVGDEIGAEAAAAGMGHMSSWRVDTLVGSFCEVVR